MTKRPLNPLIPITFLVIAFALVITLGAVRQRQSYLIRGIPEDLPGPINGAGVEPGINVYLEQYDQQELDQNLESISQAGYKVIKQSFYFSESFDWNAADRLFSAAAAHDLILVPLLDGNPENDFAPPSDPLAYAAWTGEFAQRYGQFVDHYIVWDEPNLTTHWGMQYVNPAEYAALLTAAAEAIRGMDPGAMIVAAPLAPTIETGPKNLADPLYLQELYDAGAADAFDIIAGKPYGFDYPASDRQVDLGTLNFSRIILLREVMEQNGDEAKAIWAGNWGWNSLPEDWSGEPSIWGQVSKQHQVEWTLAALERAQQEWPWMGTMFLENWEPNKPAHDPAWGFSLADQPLPGLLPDKSISQTLAYPGFAFAEVGRGSQKYSGFWRFSPRYGADVGLSGDEATFRFWGTDVGLRVRRADYNARFFVTVDGEPANALPLDKQGATLVLNSPDPSHDYLAIEPVAKDLEPGPHTLILTALRGSDQWALNGFSVGYKPPDTWYKTSLIILGVLAIFAVGLAFYTGRRSKWGSFGDATINAYQRIGHRGQLLLTMASAIIVSLAGWFTWGEQVAGIYRRLGDPGQLALTAVAASIFYVTPTFLIFVIALITLFGLLYLRPVLGLALIAFTIPFYVQPKPVLGYRFSPVEIFLLLASAAFALRAINQKFIRKVSSNPITNPFFSWRMADWSVLAFTILATLSLLFTEKLDVATNEWRVLIFEGALFFGLLRLMRINRREMWLILDAFILGGVAIALIGLWQYVTGQNLITSEGGLMRLRSIYGSPNNVALYLGRIIPILVAGLLMDRTVRRWGYGLALLPIGLAMLFSFSKGALIIGLPASILAVFFLWRHYAGGKIWPWLIGLAVAGTAAVLIAIQIPQLSGRLNPQGDTGTFRLSLWQASLNMWQDHPIIGVGLDNFLYEYRGRYILEEAWREPDLNHPHNIVLDFATRLGLSGLILGLWMILNYFNITRKLPNKVVSQWQPVAVGLLGSLIYILTHGLVDHSFFLVDLAFAFYFLFGLVIWLDDNGSTADESRNQSAPDGFS